MKTLLLVAPLLASACDSARIAGGNVVASGTEPAGSLAGAWTPSDCRDARGAPSAVGAGAVKLIRKADGRFVLVETRAGYDSIVVVNSFVRGQDRVFQLALKSAASAPFLREYRVPAARPGPGRFVLVARQWDSRDTDDGFTAWYVKPAVTCALLPDRAAGT